MFALQLAPEDEDSDENMKEISKKGSEEDKSEEEKEEEKEEEEIIEEEEVENESIVTFQDFQNWEGGSANKEEVEND